MYFFSTDKYFFITGIGVAVPIGLLQTASQYPVFFITRVIVNMFLDLAYQVPVRIIASVLLRVPVLHFPAGQFCFDRVTAFIVVMAFALLLSADQPLFITTIIMLMFFDPAYSSLFQRDCRQDQSIGSDKDDYSRHRRYDSCKKPSLSSVL